MNKHMYMNIKNSFLTRETNNSINALIIGINISFNKQYIFPKNQPLLFSPLNKATLQTICIYHNENDK